MPEECDFIKSSHWRDTSHDGDAHPVMMLPEAAQNIAWKETDTHAIYPFPLLKNHWNGRKATSL